MLYRLRTFKEVDGTHRYMTAKAKNLKELSKLMIDADGRQYVLIETYRSH